MKASPQDLQAMLGGAGAALSALALNPQARRATKYVSPKLTVKASRQRPHSARARAETFVVTMGAPNFSERRFIADCKKAGEPFPVRRVQITAWPAKRAR